VVSLQKLEDHAARQVEMYSAARTRFAEVLDEIQRINDADWSDDTFRDELNKAVVTIDTARKEFVKIQAAVETVGGPVTLFDPDRPRSHSGDGEDETSRTFGQWVKIGFAVSLPLIVALAIVVAALLATRGT